MSLVPVDTSSEVSVTDYLTQVRDWLTTCVEMTGPVEIAAARAEIATAAEAAKQLNLSKDTRDLATEMVRRAEFAVSRSIKQGQEEGLVRTQGQGGGRPSQLIADSEKLIPTVRDIAPDLYFNGSEIASLGHASPSQFDDALEEAKAEGNLSRANVVRKVRQQVSPTTRDARADVIRDLAEQGYSSRQMPARVGVTEESVRKIARDFSIDIPADKIVGRTRRIDHTHIVESTVFGLEDSVSALALIEFTEVDPANAGEWATSLSNSLKELARFLKQIKEMTQP